MVGSGCSKLVGVEQPEGGGRPVLEDGQEDVSEEARVGQAGVAGGAQTLRGDNHHILNFLSLVKL